MIRAGTTFPRCRTGRGVRCPPHTSSPRGTARPREHSTQQGSTFPELPCTAGPVHHHHYTPTPRRKGRTQRQSPHTQLQRQLASNIRCCMSKARADRRLPRTSDQPYKPRKTRPTRRRTSRRRRPKSSPRCKNMLQARRRPQHTRTRHCRRCTPRLYPHMSQRPRASNTPPHTCMRPPEHRCQRTPFRCRIAHTSLSPQRIQRTSPMQRRNPQGTCTQLPARHFRRNCYRRRTRRNCPNYPHTQ